MTTQIKRFVKQSFIVWVALLVALCAAAVVISYSLAYDSAPTDTILSAPQAYTELRAGERLLIDIRTPTEWRRTGIPAGAATADFNALDDRAFVDRIAALAGGDRSAPVALICARGGRSARALDLLKEHGFSDVRNISEGVLGNGRGPGWQARNLPLEAPN